MILIPLLILGPALAQESPKEGSFELAPQVIKEGGCPVDIVSAKAFLDLNSFGAPEYSRVYITYKNVSGKNVYSVNFRVRYSNEEGANLGTFQGSRTATVTPDGEGSEKWKKAGGLNPKITSYKVRILQVKFEDGSQWTSEAMSNVGKTQQQQGEDQGSGEASYQPAPQQQIQPPSQQPTQQPAQLPTQQLPQPNQQYPQPGGDAPGINPQDKSPSADSGNAPGVTPEAAPGFDTEDQGDAFSR